MIKPNGYDEAIAYNGEFKRLPKGGYICKIRKLEEGTGKNSGAPQLIIYLDIADGEYKNFFAEKYRNDTREFPKWGCVAYQPILDSTTGKTNPRFKAFLTAIEESNPGFVVDKTWGDDFVKFYRDKYIGFIFGDEHYIGNDDKEHVIAKPRFSASIDKIKKGDFTIPEDVYSDGTAPAETNTPTNSTQEFEVIPPPEDDDVPF